MQCAKDDDVVGWELCYPTLNVPLLQDVKDGAPMFVLDAVREEKPGVVRGPVSESRPGAADEAVGK
jgi:hypothetical protein